MGEENISGQAPASPLVQISLPLSPFFFSIFSPPFFPALHAIGGVLSSSYPSVSNCAWRGVTFDKPHLTWLYYIV